MSERPIEQIKMGSGISVDIWKNQAKDGSDYYTASVSRSYMGDDKQWHQTSSFSRDQLPKLALAANRAFEKIVDLQSGQSAEKSEDKESFVEKEKARRGSKAAAK